MAKDTEPTMAAPEVAKLVDPNTGLEVAPVPDSFDDLVKSLGYNKPCEDC